VTVKTGPLEPRSQLRAWFVCASGEEPGGHNGSAARRSADRSWVARVASSGSRDTRPDLTPERKREGIRAIGVHSVRVQSPRLNGCDGFATRPKPPTACNRDDVGDAGGTERPEGCGSSPGKVGSKSSTSHRGQGFPIEVILQHGSLASRCPGSATMGSLAQSAFVDEDDDEPLFLGFFLISGQRLRFHCAMARSSRSRARPVGRWQLQPSCRSSRHTCPG